MTINSFRKILRAAIWTAAIGFAFLVALHLLLPHIVNTPAMRSHILELAADHIPGDLDFHRLKPALLPQPHAILLQSRLNITDKLTVRAAEIGLFPRFTALIAGSLQVERLEIIDLDVEIHLPPEGPNHIADEPNRPRQSASEQLKTVAGKLAPLLGGIDIELQNSRVVVVPGQAAPITFSGIDLQASAKGNQLDLRLQGRSTMSDTFQLQGEIDLKTFDSRSRLQVAGLHMERMASLVLHSHPIAGMVMDMEIALQTIGLGELEAGITARAPGVRLARRGKETSLAELALSGNVHWNRRQMMVDVTELKTADPNLHLNASLIWPAASPPPADPIKITINASDLEMAALGRHARLLADDFGPIRQVFDIVPSAGIPELSVTATTPTWSGLADAAHIRGTARIEGGRVVIPGDLVRLDDVNGTIGLENGRLKGSNLSARMGSSRARNALLDIDLLKGTRGFTLKTDLDADLSDLPPVLRKLAGQAKAGDWLDRLPPVKGSASGRLELGPRWDTLQADLIITRSRIRMLDGDIEVSGNMDGLPTPRSQADLAVTGRFGPDVLQWLAEAADLSSDYLPDEPVTIIQSKLRRESDGTMGIEGDMVLGGDLAVTTRLAVDSNIIRVERLTIKDGRSNAQFTLNHKRPGQKWDMRFEGRLDQTTVGRFWRRPRWIAGWVEGEIRSQLDMERPARSILQGELTAGNVDIVLSGKHPLRISNARINAQKNRFTIPSADLVWQDQSVNLNGSAELSENIIDLDLKLTAAELDTTPLVTQLEENKQASENKRPRNQSMPRIQGRIQLAVEQMKSHGFRLAPLKAVILLKDKEATVDVTEMQICGLSTPGKIAISPSGAELDIKLQARDASLKESGECLALAGITERLEGKVNLVGRLKTRGKGREAMVRNLDGRVTLDIADGRIYNVGSAGLLTNLLSYLSVNQLVKGGMPDLRKNDFAYNSISANIIFRDGTLVAEEGVLKSNAINIAGNGRLKLADNHLDMTLLVSPLTTVDWIVERLPVVGRILKGTLIAIPVGVKGPTADPNVIPLAPSAVGSRVGGILKRTIETPFRIIAPVLPEKPPSKKDNPAGG